MFPSTIDEYVSETDPVRAYDAFVEALSLDEAGIKVGNPNVGSPAYDPKSMLKLLLYGYSYGWRSSRKLERATHHNMSFIWLMGGLQPDHKTIARFRKDNKDALRKVLVQLSRICIKLNLIEGSTLFLDGTKIRGNASINQTRSQAWLEIKLEEIDKRIEELFVECDRIDNMENGGSFVEMSDELSNQKKLKEKISNALEHLKKESLTKVNLTDNESVNMKGRQGSHAGYNAQVVVDEKNGLIVNTDVVNINTDFNQFSKQIELANDVLEKKCETACADAGYSNAKNLKKTFDNNITVIVPSQKQALHKPSKENPFSKEHFTYDKEYDQYICPEGNVLRLSYYSKVREQYRYRMVDTSICKDCKHYGQCTRNKRGRSIRRLKDEKQKRHWKNYMKPMRDRKFIKNEKKRLSYLLAI